MSDISGDLALFNELVEILINEEDKQPVADRIDANELYDAIDLSLNDSGMVDDDFKGVLRDILVSTPKTATNLFFN
ncbi:MAG: sulfinoalanine decarboxylase, partial [Glaciecola sp.]